MRIKRRELLSAGLFLKDRIFYSLSNLVIIGILVVLMMLERERYSGFIEMSTVFYFIILACFVIAVWLAFDYVRQRHFYRQLAEALERSEEPQAASLVQSPVTGEQKLVVRLLEEQHRAYLNELGKYRRRQEQHNHFVLQWVHHMKTPVSVIDLLAQEALQRQPESPLEHQQLMGSVQEESDRLTRGLEMMLYTARLEKFEIDLHIQRTPLHELIRAVINAHKRLCIRYSIFPRMEGELWVETDKKWMTFVLNQLVSNAIKYSKQKEGTKPLLFRLDPYGEGGRLEVADEGIGIAPHDLGRIFDPFFTGENGRTTGESTGMGLYLAKQVCGKLGHSLTVSSVLGEGTAFTIEFEPKGIHLLS